VKYVTHRSDAVPCKHGTQIICINSSQLWVLRNPDVTYRREMMALVCMQILPICFRRLHTFCTTQIEVVPLSWTPFMGAILERVPQKLNHLLRAKLGSYIRHTQTADEMGCWRQVLHFNTDLPPLFTENTPHHRPANAKHTQLVLTLLKLQLLEHQNVHHRVHKISNEKLSRAPWFRHTPSCRMYFSIIRSMSGLLKNMNRMKRIYKFCKKNVQLLNIKAHGTHSLELFFKVVNTQCVETFYKRSLQVLIFLVTYFQYHPFSTVLFNNFILSTEYLRVSYSHRKPQLFPHNSI
jgi:hypothetical protein